MRVLVVEDHPKLATAVGTVLRREGMAVDIVFDGHDALAHVAATAYDVVVLDRDLPGVSGDDVCRSLVAGGDDTRVLMLTAAATIDDRVDGLGIGADDYLAKPFAFPELVARIRALARRARPMLPPTLVYSDVRLDSIHRVATRAGQRLVLRPKEFAVLELLLGAEGAVVSAEEILDRVWDEAADPFTNSVRMTVSRLRAKLGDPPLIETVSPVGYRICSSTMRVSRQSICSAGIATSAPTDHGARTPHAPLRQSVSRLGRCTSRSDLRSRRTHLSDCESKVHSVWCWIHLWRTYEPSAGGDHRATSPSALAALVSAQRNTDLHHLLVDCLIVLGIMAVPPSRSAGSSQGGFCVHYGRSRQPRGRSPRTTSTSGSRRRAPRRAQGPRATPSTVSSPAWRRRSRRNDDLWRTPPTNCAPRSPSDVPCSK